MSVSTADLNGFLRDLFDVRDEIDSHSFRQILARNRLTIVKIDEQNLPVLSEEDRGKIEREGASKLWGALQGFAQRVRVGSGRLQDGVLLDDVDVTSYLP